MTELRPFTPHHSANMHKPAHRLWIPTIYDTPEDFRQLFELWTITQHHPGPFVADFTHCQFLAHPGVAFLGGLTMWLRQQKKPLELEWGTIREAIRTNLRQNGFVHMFRPYEKPWAGNSIPFRHDPSPDAHGFLGYLRHEWLGRGWVTIPQELTNTISGRLLELYFNAFEHGRSPIGVFSCGQHYPTKGIIGLTIADFGVGIPTNVRTFSHNLDVPAYMAIRWAFQRGTSTDPRRTSRGLGLDLIKEFIRTTQGRLDVYSHDGHALIDPRQERYQSQPWSFPGTIVNLMISCDPSTYPPIKPTPAGVRF